MHQVLVLVALAACDKVYSLDRPDAGPACWNPMLVDDEDHDTIPDGCDACPTSPTQEGDADGDGLLDPCDPDERTQHLVDFAGFEMDGQGWAGPTWQATLGAFGPLDPVGTQVARRTLPPALEPSIEAPIRFPPQAVGAAGLGLHVGDIDVACYYRYADGDDRVVLIVGTEVQYELFNTGPGLRLHLDQTSDGVLHCRATDATSASAVLDSAPLVETTIVEALVLTDNVVATFDWVMIIGVASPTN